MKIITLPDQLNLAPSASVQVVDYHTSREVSKQKIILNKNTFSFLMEGAKEVVFENSSLSIDNSKFLILKSGHCLMTEKLSATSNYRSVLLFFSTEMILKFIRKLENINKIESSTYPSVCAFSYDPFIKRFVNSLLDISQLSTPIKSKLLEVKFEEIMLYLMEKYGTDFLYSLITNSNDVIQKFIRTIESNQWSRLTLKELAFLCDMSVSSFKREFEKHYSESPIKWFQNKRLEYAYHLLHHEHKSASEIYFEVGYENLSSFVQAFKSKYGVTPKHHHRI